MHQTKKGNQWYFGMKAHIAVDAESGLVHTVTTTPANEAGVDQIAEGRPATTQRCPKAGSKLDSRRMGTIRPDPGQGGTIVSGNQELARLDQGALQGAGQEHGEFGDTVCAGQTMDGAQDADGDDGRRPCETMVGRRKRGGSRREAHGIWRNPTSRDAFEKIVGYRAMNSRLDQTLPNV